MLQYNYSKENKENRSVAVLPEKEGRYKEVHIMKIWKNENMTMVTGDAKEISRLYRNLEKRENIFPEFCTAPKFNFEKKIWFITHLLRLV